MMANARSREYYQSAAGKQKKKAANARRYQTHDECTVTIPDSALSLQFTPALVNHLRLVIRLIEKRRVDQGDIVALLHRIERQRSLVSIPTIVISRQER